MRKSEPYKSLKLRLKLFGQFEIDYLIYKSFWSK